VAVNIKQLELLYFQNDEPVPYKLKCGVEINISPISVRNWGLFNNCLDCLRINKNEINDIDIIQMFYLDFLNKIISSGTEESNQFKYNLACILKFSMDVNYFLISTENGKSVIVVCDENRIILYKMYPKDFDDIKKIILYQNIPNYDDRYLDPTIRKAIESYNKTKSQNQISPTLEKQKVFVISKTGMSMERINKMTYRTFIQIYDFNIKDDLYLIRNMYKTSYKYDVGEEILHPLYEKEKDIFDEIFIDADSFTKKIQM